MPQVDLRGHTVEELAKAANVSVETIQNAIRMRQQQLMLEQQSALYKQLDQSKTISPTRPPTRPTTKTTTTTTTTPPPPTTPKYVMNGGSKVKSESINCLETLNNILITVAGNERAQGVLSGWLR